MGKLLRKFIHGILPSLFSKIKSSSGASSLSPKKFLPFLRGGASRRDFFSFENPDHVILLHTPDDDDCCWSSDENQTSLLMTLNHRRSPSLASESTVIDNSVHEADDMIQHQTTRGMHVSSCAHSQIKLDHRPMETSEDRQDEHGVCHESCFCSANPQDAEYHGPDEDTPHPRNSPSHTEIISCSRLGEASSDDEIIQQRKEHMHHRGHQVDAKSKAKRKRECARERQTQKRAKVASCRLPESICAVVGDGTAEVQYRQDAEKAFWESMVEMIVGNGLWADMAALRFLLACYLCLNEPELHGTIQSSFLRVLDDLWIT